MARSPRIAGSPATRRFRSTTASMSSCQDGRIPQERQLSQRRPIFALKRCGRRTCADRAAGLGALHAQAGRDHRGLRRRPEQEHRPLADPRSSRPLRGVGAVHGEGLRLARRFTRAASSSPMASARAGAHSFTNRPVDVTGDFVDNHKVLDDPFGGLRQLRPGWPVGVGALSVPYSADSKGPLTITAKVNYRHLRQSYLNNVFGKDHPAYPMVEIASRTRTLNIGDNPADSRLPPTIPTGCAGTTWASVSRPTAIRGCDSRL
jgi:hypothetical protein